jgi:hypothetical protein
VKSISIGTEALGTLIGAPPSDFEDARWYEVAGASHISLHDASYIDPVIKEDGLLRDANGQPLTLTEELLTQGCLKTPLFSRVPSGHVLDAALEHLVKWIKTGEVPPTAQRFERTATGQLLRDAEGRVHGGVRLSAYDAPTAANAGGDNPPTVFCALSGYHLDYTDEKLCDIYGSHRGYAERVARSPNAHTELVLLCTMMHSKRCWLPSGFTFRAAQMTQLGGDAANWPAPRY